MNMRLNALKKQQMESQKKYTNMKISELIKELETLKAKHGDLIVIATDYVEGTYEIRGAYQNEYFVYNGKNEGTYDTQLAVKLC